MQNIISFVSKKELGKSFLKLLSLGKSSELVKKGHCITTDEWILSEKILHS